MRLPDLRSRRMTSLAAALVLLLGVAGVTAMTLRTRSEAGRAGTATIVDAATDRPSAQPVPSLAPSLAPTLVPTPAAVAATRATGSKDAAGDSPLQVSLPALVRGALVRGSSGRLVDVHQDQGVTVPLPDGRDLWIFADTLQVGHQPAFFVTSSAAVSRRGSQRLTYLSSGGVKPLEFLARTAAERAGQVAGTHYTAVWPTGATMLPDGRVLVGYAKYDVTVASSTFVFQGAGFFTYRYRGFGSVTKGHHADRLGQVWGVDDGPVGSPVYSGGYVYVALCRSLECYSARTTPANLGSRGSYRWWNGSGWGSAGGRKPMTYGANRPAGNPSIVKVGDAFLTVSTSAGTASPTGLLWVSRHPWGPWSTPKAFTMPGCGAAGCYTLNLHPAESSTSRVRVGYATAGVGPYVHVTDVPIRLDGTSSIR